jgi:hypothetical protein
MTTKLHKTKRLLAEPDVCFLIRDGRCRCRASASAISISAGNEQDKEYKNNQKHHGPTGKRSKTSIPHAKVLLSVASFFGFENSVSVTVSATRDQQDKEYENNEKDYCPAGDRAKCTAIPHTPFPLSIQHTITDARLIKKDTGKNGFVPKYISIPPVIMVDFTRKNTLVYTFLLFWHIL